MRQQPDTQIEIACNTTILTTTNTTHTWHIVHSTGMRPLCSTPTHTHNRFMALFRDHPGEPVPEEYFWTLWCKGRLTDWLGATASGLTSAQLHHPHVFYGLDALPVAQPTVSKHWRHTMIFGAQHQVSSYSRHVPFCKDARCTVS